MKFAFLHPEFFVLMLPPMVILFYFWQTQQSKEHRFFSDEILRKLRAPATTMGLKGRNILFLCASVLMITAMAQPVIFENSDIGQGRADILIALDLSRKSEEAFKKEKSDAAALIRSLKGERIGIVGYDEVLYRISPMSIDSEMLMYLIQGLDPEVMTKPSADAALIWKIKHQGLRVYIGSETATGDENGYVYMRGTDDIGLITAKVDALKNAQTFYAHIPLFPYPLGLSMLLIWIALSSMSKRRSVPLLVVLALIMGDRPAVSAGMLDFQTLRKGYDAYEHGEYERSAHYFREYRLSHDSAEVRYNLANALYRSGKYDEARYWYRKVYSNNPVLMRRAAYNLALSEEKSVSEVKRSTSKTLNPLFRPTADIRVKSDGEAKPKYSTRLYKFF